MFKSKYFIPVAVSLAILLLSVASFPAEAPVLLKPRGPFPPQTLHSKLSKRRTPVHLRNRQEELQILLADTVIRGFAQNSISQDGLATGEPDPVLMKIIKESKSKNH